VTVVIKVDYDALSDMAGRLMGLKQEFDGAETTMEGYGDALDHGDLSGELHTFATNWSDKKKDVGTRIEEVSGMASGASDCYRGVDTDLCDQYLNA
jgi:hypothetical protein